MKDGIFRVAARAPLPDNGAVHVRSRELFKQAREVLIEHAGQLYRLRITQQNKLILNK